MRKNKAIEDDVQFNHHPIHHYPKIREKVVEIYGECLRNLAPKRKEKLIQAGVLIWMKGSNSIVQKALDTIHFPEKEADKKDLEPQE